MSIQVATDPLWPSHPGLDATPSSLEVSLTTALIYAEFALIAVAVIAFIGASALLIFATKAKGRYLVLAGVGLLVSLGIYSWVSMRNLTGNTVLELAAVKAATALAFSLIVLGFLHAVWLLHRSGRATRSA